MGIQTTTVAEGGGDYRWLKSARGTTHPKSGTLDFSAFTEADHYPDGYFPTGTPVTFDAGSGLYEPAAATDSAELLAGFVGHDVAVAGTADLPCSILTDATIDASFLPGTYDLVDGRYLCDQVSVEAAP